jgi:molecular chaperone DnaK (HSP70)
VSVAAWQLTSDASGIIESSVASSTVIPAAEVNPFAEDLIREQLSSAVGQAAEAEYSHPTTSAEIVDVAPSDLAMVTMDPESGEPVADVIVPSGSVLPTSVTKTFGTAFDDQTQVVVTLHERKVSGQEMMDDVAEFRELVSLVLDLVGGAPAGSPIRVTVSVAVDGVLVVEVQGPQQETVSFESEHHVNPGRPAARDEAERS